MPQMDISKEVKFLNKDFTSFRNALINFAKIYYPTSYKDFNESAIGTMFIEMSAYVGDVLSYYLDSNLKESMLIYAEEYKNLLYLAQSMGYKVKSSFPATTIVEVYQQLPATGQGGKDIDFKYALKIGENMILPSETSPTVQFRTLEPIDFSNYLTQGFTATVYQVDSAGTPLIYLIKKTVPVVAGNISQVEANFDEPIQFTTYTIPFTDIIDIIDVVDSDGDYWYEVDFLAQDTVQVESPNDDFYNTTSNAAAKIEAPSTLQLKRVSKRFVVKKTVEGYTQLQFGSGVSAYADNMIIPNPQTVNEFLAKFSFMDVANNFLNTRTYGLVPSNTTLTIRFTKGGGIDSNIPQNDLVKISSLNLLKTVDDFTSTQDKQLFSQMRSSLAVTNTEPATGGRGAETAEEIRQNAIAFFYAQNRCVTDQDYVIRTLSMPSKYGSVSKAYARKSPDNFALDLYVLGYDFQGKLTTLGDTTKQNLAAYLSSFKDLSTTVNIKDGYIVNIGVQFSIVTLPKFNKNEVVLSCIEQIKNYFQNDKWQINQPIYLSDIYNFLDNVDGVRTVSDVNIYNKYSTLGFSEYSNNYYNIKAATIDDIVYPSLDPCIFEIKYPNLDIEGQSK